MTVYETLKQIIWDIGIWQSHIVTIIFTTILATIASYYALRKFQRLYKLLAGTISICCVCKKIYDSKEDEWKEIDDFINTHSEASFSHGYCPECEKKCKEELLNK